MSQPNIRKSAAEEALYLASPGATDEARRAIDISVIGAGGAGGAATFCPLLPLDVGAAGDDGSARAAQAALKAAWDEWLTQRFELALGGPFCRIHEAAGQMRMGEILRADRDIDSALSESEKRRSLVAARAFLEGREKVRHMPQLVRLAEAIDRAEAPGHVTTLFAMQAGLYHLPRLAALISYAHFEWLGGLVAADWRGERGMKTFEVDFPQTFESVRRILQGDNSDHGESDGVSSIFSVK